MREDLPLSTTHEVRDRCLCLQLQRAARSIGRRFDSALRPLGLSHGQFSLLTALNRPEPPLLGAVAELLALDRTTLTANLKPLERRGLVRVESDAVDGRRRRLVLTDAGRDVLVEALPVWRHTHDGIDDLLGSLDSAALRDALSALTWELSREETAAVTAP